MSDGPQHEPDFNQLTDAELVQRIADLQSTVNAMLAEITRRLANQPSPTAPPVNADQESADKNKLWGGIMHQDEKGHAL